MTAERRIYLQESVPRGQGEVVLPPVIVVDTTGIDIGAVGKPETTAPAQLLELSGHPSGVPSPLSGLAQRRSCEEPLDVRPLSIRLHPTPIGAIEAQPVGPTILWDSTACREGSRRYHKCPPPSRDRHCLKTPSGRKPPAEAPLPAGITHWFWLPVVSAPVFFFIIGSRALSGLSPAWGTPAIGFLPGRPKMYTELPSG
jgi:hypothetical protein